MHRHDRRCTPGLQPAGIRIGDRWTVVPRVTGDQFWSTPIGTSCSKIDDRTSDDPRESLRNPPGAASVESKLGQIVRPTPDEPAKPTGVVGVQAVVAATPAQTAIATTDPGTRSILEDDRYRLASHSVPAFPTDRSRERLRDLEGLARRIGDGGFLPRRMRSLTRFFGLLAPGPGAKVEASIRIRDARGFEPYAKPSTKAATCGPDRLMGTVPTSCRCRH